MKKELHEIQWLDCKVESNIVEGNSGKTKVQYILTGPFMKADVPTRNGNVYKREEANKAIANLRPMVAERRIRMLVDHPEWFGSASITKSGALLMEITDVQEDGYAYYKAKVMNTAAGKDLKAVLDAGSKLGVSTRGRGFVKEEEIPGYEGKFSVVTDWELVSIDFVDDPAVLDTEAYMHMESNKRRPGMFKTVEELKAACPELAQKIAESAIVELKSEYDGKLQEADKKFNDTAHVVEQKTAELEKLVESIKTVFPDKFVVVEESKLVSEKEGRIAELENSLKESSKDAETLRAEMKEMKDAHVKAERDSYIEHLKATDEEYFKFESFKDCFENCLTKDEVQTAYESNAKILKEMKEKVVAPAPAKSTQTEESSEAKPDGLTEEQHKDLRAKNLQRKRSGLVAWTEAKYLEMFGQKK